MSEKVIIDGVNVAECRFFDEWEHCKICEELNDGHCLIVADIECKTYDACYYKQLQRAKAEMSELQKGREIINKINTLSFNDFSRNFSVEEYAQQMALKAQLRWEEIQVENATTEQLLKAKKLIENELRKRGEE